MTAPSGIPSPMAFFDRLVWLDGRPLVEVIEPYRAKIFEDVLYSFDPDGRPTYNLALLGRAKKCWKSADLILAALYRLLVWPSVLGNDCFVLANDEAQAADDLTIAKRLIQCNPKLLADVDVREKALVRTDGRGELRILPAGDVAGMHGKSYCFCGYDEIHAYRDWSIFEAMQPDPTRPDALQWITSYNSLYQSAGYPLYDLLKAGKGGGDARMYFSWYAADYCSEPGFEEGKTPEERANPSMASWADAGYLEQQKRRLPSSKYRRLHLNLAGAPDGAAFDAALVMAAVVPGRERLAPQPDVQFHAFVDMAGGSHDDACLAISHWDAAREIVVVDLVVDQGRRPPFSPREAVQKFARICHEYRISRVCGDRFAGLTFEQDFRDADILYEVADRSKSDLYEGFEVRLNAGEVELLDKPRLTEQLLGLIWKGAKIDHQSGGADDWCNAVAGAVHLAREPWEVTSDHFWVAQDGLAAQMQRLASEGITGNEARLEIVSPARPWEEDGPDYSGARGPYII